jgi:hypothetical protein
MVATSRFVQFDIDAATSVVSGLGTRGYVESSSAGDTSDTITITQGVDDQLDLNIDSQGFFTITLPSGTNLDSRMLAREIGWLANSGVHNDVTAEFVNGKFRIYSEVVGPSSSVVTQSGPRTCRHLLGMATGGNTFAGVGASNGYTGAMTVSGTYRGQFDDYYTVIVGNRHTTGEATTSGTYAGSVTTGGTWNESSGSETYTVTISAPTGKQVMNAGTGNVPTFTVNSTGGDVNLSPQELLYSDYWYEIGSKGLRLKFEDAPFATGDTIEVTCSAIEYVDAAGTVTTTGVGVAQYVWSSHREGKSPSATTSQVAPATAVGTKGIGVQFANTDTLTKQDEFRIICTGPQPSVRGYGATLLNFGSVTVSTYSPTKAIWFELMSGATILSSPAFGLQSHGSASHHGSGNGNEDTYFGFGTAGERNPGSSQAQWTAGITGNDLSSDTPPPSGDLYATQRDLQEVTTADASEDIGVAYGEMITDFIWLAIKLGAAETGANPSIVWRQFYDFS